MATIEQRPNGHYRVKIRKKGVAKTATFIRYADAISWANRIETEIEDKLHSPHNQKILFKNLIDRYRAEVTPTKRGAKQENYRLIRISNTFLGDIYISELTAQDFANWRDMRLKEVSPDSVNKELGVLSAICNHAMKEWGMLRENFITKISKPKSSKPRNRRPTADEINQICIALGYDKNTKPETKSSRCALAFLFAIETAMRAGEICGLQWQHIDFKARLAHLSQTKNGFSRDVPLSKNALEIINQLKGIDETSIFAIDSALLDALFRKAKRKCEIEDLHFHDSRREALTRMAKKVPVELLAKISGHRDLKILLNTYYAPDMAGVARLLDE